MKTIRVNGENFSVIFDQKNVARMSHDGFETVEQTQCALVGAEGRIHAIGRAFRAPQDAPDDVKAAKIAFGRAVNTFTENYLTRKLLWDAFRPAMAQQAAKAEAHERQVAQQLVAEQQKFEDAAFTAAADLYPFTVEGASQQRIEKLRNTIQSCVQPNCFFCPELQNELDKLEGR